MLRQYDISKLLSKLLDDCDDDDEMTDEFSDGNDDTIVMGQFHVSVNDIQTGSFFIVKLIQGKKPVLRYVWKALNIPDSFNCDYSIEIELCRKMKPKSFK